MPNFCAVVGYSNRADKHMSVGFYRLPAIISHQGEQTYELSYKRRDLWLSRIHREDLGPSKYPYVRVCSLHFVSGKPSDLYDNNHPDWAPSLHLGGAPEPPSNLDQERYERAVLISKKRSKASEAASQVLEELEQAEPDNTISTQTDEAGRITYRHLLRRYPAQVKKLEISCEELKVKCARLEGDNGCRVREQRMMEKRLKETMLDEDSFLDKVLFYTGLTNWKILFVVFCFVWSNIAATRWTHIPLSIPTATTYINATSTIALSTRVLDLGY